ncbi:GNAT family N-acetyltransferase [Glycomyces sp. TRM65418]|uniref:GNAT family N-acetyltransferase n=1 Tax=Glycomyces sp. TRM65418 TaxID=2867006 RepID=UPI001CE6B05A|nr:GNAT family N-acetyltransferase [Glycomyces sp. TRM65418]MCC3763941.1 GNAT family N-acetyltransferase [Glycomyces sp. TRM65418]QZD53641.1 GNAT family N-acetyltransferase [Glycomyces sp. TRM65418]
MAYRMVEQTQPGGRLAQVYRELLVPAFPANEIESEQRIAETLEAGRGSLFIAVDDGGRPAAAAFGRWWEASRVQLLSYLAVAARTRGHGLGGRLLRHAVEAWRERYDPCMVVAEIESPDAPMVHEDYGDPRRRVAFYQAAGARVLDLPYFQPGIGDPARRVRGMLLLVLHADPSFAPDDPGRVAGAPLRAFMEAYLEESEGAKPHDWDAATLFKAIDRPGGVPMGRWQRDPR